MSLCYDCMQLSDNKKDYRFRETKGKLILCDRCNKINNEWCLEMQK